MFIPAAGMKPRSYKQPVNNRKMRSWYGSAPSFSITFFGCAPTINRDHLAGCPIAQLSEEDGMSHYKILSGAIAIAALVTFTPTGQARQYNGPRKVGDQCFKPGSSGAGMGYWEAC